MQTYIGYPDETYIPPSAYMILEATFVAFAQARINRSRIMTRIYDQDKQPPKVGFVSVYLGSLDNRVVFRIQ